MLAILHPLLSNHIDERAEYFFNNVVNELDRPRHERLESVDDVVDRSTTGLGTPADSGPWPRGTWPGRPR